MHITSDAFFERSMVKFDVIFIDGLHEEHQVDRDIVNSLQHLNPGGIIVLHDCLPPRRMASTSSASFLEGRKLERHSLDECT
jgi:predicted O-methyltransferase YrrM